MAALIASTPVGTAGVAVGGTADERNLAIASRMQMRHQGRRGLGIGKSDDMANRSLRQIPGFNHRNAAVLQKLAAARCVPAAGDDNGFGSAPQHGFDQAFFLLDRVVGVAQKQLAARTLQRIGQPARRIGKVGIVDRGDEGRHKTGTFR